MQLTLLQFIHDPLLTWRLTTTKTASPTGPDFQSAGDPVVSGGPQGPRGRRPSILEADAPPSELLAMGDTSALTGGTSRSRARTNSSAVPGSMANGINGQDGPETQNARALEVLDRVSQKLTGRDFKPEEELDIVSQVNKLITEATKLENLCQHYIGWCSFW